MLGFEADFDTSTISSTRIVGCSFPCINSVGWLATVRGRVGKTLGPHLFYATGGVAFANIRVRAGSAYDAAATNTGWTAGAGFETPLGPHWTMKAEYLYANFGAGVCAPISIAPGTCALSEFTHLNIFRGGLNYHF